MRESAIFRHIRPPMKKTVTVLLLLCSVLPLAAQNRREALLEYGARRRQAYTEFRENYRKACADFMRKRWEAFQAEAPVPVPQREEPDRPAVKPAGSPAAATATPLPHLGTVTPPDRRTEPEPVTDTPAQTGGEPAIDTRRSCRFTFYGTECSVSLPASARFQLASLQEDAVADAWEAISRGTYDRAVRESLDLKRQLRLNDWGYYRLAESIGDAHCGAGTDESVLVQSFLLAEAGYKIRLARGDNRLRLLLAVGQRVYARPYFQIDGEKFYLLDGKPRAASYRICNFSIPGERVLSLAMPEPPRLAVKAAPATEHNDRASGLQTSVSTNRNLIDFMADYPSCPWEVYAVTKLSEQTGSQLLPVLRQAIRGKEEREAAGILLQYLQNAFSYMTDDAQFGDERTFFCDEMFFYPHSDCEDRAILYARLIRELLGLKTVLLYYPNHIATAVRFNREGWGDYVQIDRDRYTICDPTYIGGEVGEAMPNLRKESARIIPID